MTQQIQNDLQERKCNPNQPASAALGERVTWHGLEEHRTILRSHLKSRCPDENDINDIIQESFLRAARYSCGPMDSGRLRGWLMRIASNVHLDKVRHRSRSPVIGLDMEIWENLGESARVEPKFCWDGGELDMTDALCCLRKAKARLRDPDRAVLAEYYMERSGTGAIARRLGVSPAMVKVRLFRARRRLKAIVEGQFRSVGMPSLACV